MESDRFEQIVGREHAWLPGGETLDGVPVSLVVRPGSVEELSACLAEASARGTALVPAGSGSKLHWGNAPAARSFVRLDLSRLRARPEIDPLEGVATLAAGMRVSELVRELYACGKRSRLETPFVDATVGGTIAADAFGPEVGPGRRLRDELLGLEVAMADGTLARCGGRVVKNVTGFDLVRLHCGAMGTLGVIVRATFRLRPLPAERRVVGLEFPEFEPAIAAAHELLAAAVEPAGVAVLRAEGRVRLLWVLEGDAADVALRGGRRPGVGRDESEWTAAARAMVESPARGVGLRLGARPSDAQALVAAVESAGGAAAVRVVLPAAGLVHAHVPAEALPALLERARARGWASFVESAPAEVKRQLDVFAPDADALPLMRALKQRFDPKRVLSPGRFAGRI
jgi:glycolate oxidase FAD binding subunit